MTSLSKKKNEKNHRLCGVFRLNSFAVFRGFCGAPESTQSDNCHQSDFRG